MRLRMLIGMIVAFMSLTHCQSKEHSVATEVDSHQVREEFLHPPKIYRPMVRWYWPGGDVEDDELRREIRFLDEANFGGAEIQSFRFGLNPQAPVNVQQRVNNYRTPEFFNHIRAALEEATQRGMWLDYTFGSGWPFGGGENITPELATMELRFRHQALSGPNSFKGKIPWPEQPPGAGSFLSRLIGGSDIIPEDWKQRLKERETLVAVIAVRGQEAVLEESGQKDILGQAVISVKKIGRLDAGTAVVLTDKVKPDGQLEWAVPEGNWQLFTFVQFPAKMRVLAGVGNFPQLVLDHLKLAALESHIQAVGEGAKPYIGHFFGRGLRALFCDSLEVPAYLYWTDSFPEDFQRLRGYDLLPFLPILKAPGYDIEDIGSRVRHDYWQTVSDLIIANFYQPLATWAEENNLLSRVQAHGAPADVMQIYGLSHIAETESLYDSGSYDFLKYAASASHVYGRPITSSESFVWITKEYQTTPEKIKRYADELITAGVNQIIYGGFPYEYMDRPEPGWYPFVSPFPYSSHMNHHNPFWKFQAPLNAYITRLQYLSQIGKNVAPVAVFRSRLPYVSSAEPSGEDRMIKRLLESGYNFDHINAHALLRSHVGNKMLISPGGAVYSQLILLNEKRMSAQLVKKLAGFAKSGLQILFIGDVPDNEVGYRDYLEKTDRIKGLMKMMLRPENTNVRLVESTEEAIHALRSSISPNLWLKKDSSNVFFIQKKIGSLDVYFLRNGSKREQSISVEFPVLEASPEVWDPWTGTITPLDNFSLSGNGVLIDLKLQPYGSKLLVFDPETKRPEKTSARKSAVKLPAPLIIGGQKQRWSLQTFGNDRQGNEETLHLELTDLVDWSKHPKLRHFSGKGHYTIDFHLDPAYLTEGICLVLDLGQVKDVAEIRVNGKKRLTLLMHPYRTEITPYLRTGKNTLEIIVTNTLLNRLIGDGMELGIVLGAFGQKPEPLPSGLLGPVRLVPVKWWPEREE